MSDETTHEDNQTPEGTDDDIKRVDKDTVTQGDARPGASVDEGVGATPTVPSDADDNDDPKSGHSPV
ncbi:MAG: hypothetical protein M3376_10155 [Actinomycetota bacterium]|nr:hypothetical protein [Actinomycetota bacterium]